MENGKADMGHVGARDVSRDETRPKTNQKGDWLPGITALEGKEGQACIRSAKRKRELSSGT